MHLILVRHGETDHNLRNLALGRADVPLNATGLRQAQVLARALSEEELAAVYSSPLQRARDTAAPIAAAHALEVMTDEGLIEMDVGEMDGLPFPEVRERFPGLIERWLSEDGPEVRMGAGERLVDVRDRARAALDRIAGGHEGDAVCLVAHNFVILSLLAEVLGLELAKARRLRHSVGAISRVELGGIRPQLVALNDTCHLGRIT